MSEAVLGQAQLSLNFFELKPRFVKDLKRLEAHFIKMVKSLSLDLKLYHKILGLSLSSLIDSCLLNGSKESIVVDNNTFPFYLIGY